MRRTLTPEVVERITAAFWEVVIAIAIGVPVGAWLVDALVCKGRC